MQRLKQKKEEKELKERQGKLKKKRVETPNQDLAVIETKFIRKGMHKRN